MIKKMLLRIIKLTKTVSIRIETTVVTEVQINRLSCTTHCALTKRPFVFRYMFVTKVSLFILLFRGYKLQLDCFLKKLHYDEHHPQ